MLSPNKRDKIRIKNLKVKIASDPLRFEELKHIEE